MSEKEFINFYAFTEDRDSLRNYSEWSRIPMGDTLRVLVKMFELRTFAEDNPIPTTNPVFDFVATVGADMGLISTGERDRLIKDAQRRPVGREEIYELLERLEEVASGDEYEIEEVTEAEIAFLESEPSTKARGGYFPVEETR